MASMMQNPDFLRSMSDMMSRPEVVDQVGDLAEYCSALLTKYFCV